MTDARVFAQEYLENILSFFGINVQVAAETSDHTIELSVPSTRLNGFLIGQKGENLRSLQHLTNMALKRGGFEDMQAVVDIAGYKRQRSERLEKQAHALAQEVLSTGREKMLDPLSAYERMIVHQALSQVEGVVTESRGEGRDRRLVIKRAESQA